MRFGAWPATARRIGRPLWLGSVVLLATGAAGPSWAESPKSPKSAESVVPPLLSEQEVRELVAQPIGVTSDEAGAVYLYWGERILVQPDGTCARREHRVVRLLGRGAIGEMGDPRIRFDEHDQELIVHRCRTYTPGGEVLDAPPRAINPVTPGAAAHCPGSIRYQDMVVTHMGLEPGCVIELDVEICDLRSPMRWLEGSTRIHEAYPIDRRELVVETPSHLPLTYSSLGTIPPPKAHESEGRREYRWLFTTLAAVRETDDGCGGWRTRKALFYSTCPSWDYLARSVRERFAEAVRVDSLMALRLATEEFEALPVRERAAAVLVLSGTEIRAAGLSPSPLPELQPAPRTFASRCGSDWDRAVLAMSLLAAVGVDTEPVLVGHPWGASSRVPMVGAFDGVWLRATGAFGPLWLDPVREETRVDPPAGRDVLGLTPAGTHWFTRESRPARSRLDVDLEVHTGGAVSGTAVLRLAGHIFDPDPWRDVKAMADRMAAVLLPRGRSAGYELLWHTADSCGLRVQLEADALGDWHGDRGYLPLTAGPVEVAAIVSPEALRRADRATPLFLSGTAVERVVWSVRLPASIHPVYVPAPSAEDHDAGRFICTTTVTDRPKGDWGAKRDGGAATDEARGKRVLVEWSLALPMSRIPPARIEELRAVIGRYRSENQRLLILGSAEAPREPL